MRKNIGITALFVLLLSGLFVASAQTTITWMVGLGTGGAPEQRDVQDQVVADFNASQSDIVLEVIYVENNVSVETLSTLIATGEAPDIVGPVGFSGANAFQGSFLDIGPLVESTGYDLSQFPEAAVNFQRTEDGLLGLPLANFPTFLFFRPELSDEAGLDYPPAAYGDSYTLDGEELEWNIATMSEVAKILTVDAEGNDATMAEFDPENIVQWGFVNQWSDPMRQHGTLFGAGTLVDDEGDATFPDHWRDAFHWWYDAIWTDHFYPNASHEGSDLLAAGNAFSSGNVAMSQTHLWYTCCIQGDDSWDAAALPSYNGQVTSRLHADTFRILKSTDSPEAAFAVLVYLTGAGSLDLLSAYGGMPARPGDQAQFFARLDETFPQGVNWQVARDGLNFPDIPSHEVWLPNNNRANDRIDGFRSLLHSTPGLDVDAEIDALVLELQLIFDDYWSSQN
jgi:multiple sugar transport system substrate-binding protein